DVQTVTIAPWSRYTELADDVTAAGADRVVPPGQMTRFRPGLSHDGFHPMSRMVRWVSTERPIEFKYRYTDMNRDQYDAQLYGIIDNVVSRRSREPVIANS
ncbi:MAG: acyl-CoA reductase, partial [Candidatus Angelobacter sp.]